MNAVLRRRLLVTLFATYLLTFGFYPATARTAEAVDPSLPTAPPDWKVELIAKAPQIQHPSVLCPAPDGRLFVAEDPVDMHLPSSEAADRILCFHPDGKVTVFAEKLHAVFGMAYVDGKLFVHHTPFLSVFTDNNGIGSDRKDLIKSTNPNPWATGGFNDHIPAAIHLAMDGYLYLITGDKGIYGAVGTDGSKAEIVGGGVMRLRPDGSDLQVFSTGTRNHLDASINSEDELFTNDNTDDGRGWWTRFTHMVDGGFYGYPWDYWPDNATPEKVQKQIESGTPGRPYTLWRMAEYGGGSPTGAIGYNEDALPEEYRGSLFHSEWGKGHVARFVVQRDGGTYKVVKREEFLKGGTELRPLGLAITPAGDGLYVADWNHGGWKSAGAGGKVGRVFKVTYTGKSLAAPKPQWFTAAAMAKPFTASTQELVDALKHPAQSVRLVAQRRIIERGKLAVAPLIALLKDDAAPPHAKWHAIWSLDRLDAGQPGRAAIVAQLKSSEASVRRQAAKELGTAVAKDAASAVAALLADPDASVRFQAATALGRIGDAAAVPGLLAKLDEQDFFTQYAMFTALNRIGRADPSAWPAVVQGLKSPNTLVRERTSFAIRNAYSPQLVEALASFVADPKNAPDARGLAMAALAPLAREAAPWNGNWWGTQPVLSPRPPKTVEWAGTAAVAAALRAGLADKEVAVRLGAINGLQSSPDAGAGEALAKLFSDEKEIAVRTAILKALAVSKPEAAAGFVVDLLKDPGGNASLVADAVAIAEKIGGAQMGGALVGVASSKDLPPASSVAVIDALGRMKEKSAVAPIAQQLASDKPDVSAAASRALASIGGDDAAAALIGVLSSDRPAARKAAVVALGQVKSPKAIEPLLKAYGDPETAKESIVALSATPDIRALDAYLEGLASPDGSTRAAARSAVLAIASTARPIIDKKLDTTVFSAQAIDELQKIYTAFVPIDQWSAVGPFANPTPPPFDVANPPTAGEFKGLDDKPTKWATLSTGPEFVSPGDVFQPGSNVMIYAVARVMSASEREVEFATGSDDSMILWLNGEKLVEDLSNSGWNPNEQHTKGKLKAGENIVVVQSGQHSGGWQFSVAVSGERAGKLFEYDTKKLDPAIYAKFAEAHAGTPDAGKAVFFKADGVGCVKCHKVALGGEGGEVGPSLAGVGAKYDRAKLIESVLYPSKQIFDGYQQSIIRTKDGNVLNGSVRGETEADLTLIDAEGRKTILKKADIDKRKVSELSMMPEGLHAALSPEAFADLIAYLAALKEAPAKQ